MVAALRKPGLGRAALGGVIGFGFGYGLVVVLRLLSGLPATQTPPPPPTTSGPLPTLNSGASG